MWSYIFQFIMHWHTHTHHNLYAKHVTFQSITVTCWGCLLESVDTCSMTTSRMVNICLCGFVWVCLPLFTQARTDTYKCADRLIIKWVKVHVCKLFHYIMMTHKHTHSQTHTVLSNNLLIRFHLSKNINICNYLRKILWWKCSTAAVTSLGPTVPLPLLPSSRTCSSLSLLSFYVSLSFILSFIMLTTAQLLLWNGEKCLSQLFSVSLSLPPSSLLAI